VQPDPYASHVHRWSRLFMRWQLIHTSLRSALPWPEGFDGRSMLHDAIDYADELLQLLGGSVDAAERRWG